VCDDHACMTTGIAVAFEMVGYSVSESTGKIEVTVSVVSTNLIFAPITVQLFSSEHGSAKGTICHQRSDQSIPGCWYILNQLQILESACYSTNWYCMEHCIHPLIGFPTGCLDPATSC
jgi:hypothetical protein